MDLQHQLLQGDALDLGDLGGGGGGMLGGVGEGALDLGDLRGGRVEDRGEQDDRGWYLLKPQSLPTPVDPPSFTHTPTHLESPHFGVVAGARVEREASPRSHAPCAPPPLFGAGATDPVLHQQGHVARGVVPGGKGGEGKGI